MVSIAPISTSAPTASAASRPKNPRIKSSMARKQPLAISDSDASEPSAPQKQLSSRCQRTSCKGTPKAGPDTNSSGMKENVKPSAAAAAAAAPAQERKSAQEQEELQPAREQPPQPLRRIKRSTRLSDRWPALMKIIKGPKSQYKVKMKRVAGHDASSDTSSDEDEDDDAITIASSSRMRYPKYLPRIFHPTAPKYPSPLCGFLPVERESVQRHQYVDRGFSRASLNNRRELWRRRRQDWEDYQFALWQAGYSSEEAYGGIEEDKQRAVHLPEHLAHGPRRRCSSALLRGLLPQELSEERPLANPALYPRLGDLLSLRDPFLLSVDICFDRFPLWSLSKLAWVFDLNSRTRHLLTSSPRRGDDSSLNEPDGSNLSGDTLVPSLSEDNNSHVTCMLLGGGASCPDLKKGLHSDDMHRVSLRSIKELPISVHRRANTVELPGTNGRSSESASFRRSSAPTPYADDPQSTKPWEICWFSRWEVIYHEISLTADLLPPADAPADLDHRNREILRKIYVSSQNLYQPFAADDGILGADEERPPPPTRRCGASVISSTSGSGNSLSAILPAEEEEDDYGEIVENPTFRLRGATIDPLSMFATVSEKNFARCSSTTEIYVDDETGRTTCTLTEDKVGIEVC